METMILSDYLALVVVGLAQFAGHYTPWQIVPPFVNARGDLHRTLAYGYGCLWLAVGLILFAVGHAPAVAVQLLVLFFALELVSAGAGTMIPRLLNVVAEWLAQKQDNQDLEGLVQEMHDQSREDRREA